MGTTPSKGSGKILTGPKLLNLGMQSPSLTSLEHLRDDYAHYLTPSLTSLNVSHNSLTSLPPSLFGLIPNLELLDLSGNLLSETLPVTLPSLKHLRDLYLGMNRFDIIPEPVFYLSTSLALLELPSNELTSIPEKISLLVNLKRLDVSSNQLKAIPDEIGCLTNLTQLKARANKIEHLSPQIGKLTNLNHLDLRQNELESIDPACLADFGVLEKLLLTDNLLRSLPPTLSDCTGLYELDLAGNKLTTIPSLHAMSSLRRLLLNDNRLTEIPVLDEMNSLRDLDLRSNQLTSIENIRNCPSLHLLSVRENRLTALPRTIGAWRNLEEFDATVNHIEEIPEEICNVTTLVRIYLSDNHISDIPLGLTRLTRLRLLGLAYNDLDDLSFPPNIWEGFSTLVELRLLGNKLTSLPKGFSKLPHLDRLFIGYNDFVPHGTEAEPPCYNNLDMNQLGLSGNPNMTKIPDSLFQSITLRKLWLGDCGIKKLPGAVGQLQLLEVLDLSNNKLTKISKKLCNLSNLIEFLVPHNDLSKLPADMDKLANLQLLDVSWNAKLTKIPTGVARINSLLQVKAIYCAIDELPEPWLNFTGYPPPPPPLSGLLLAHERPMPPVGLQLKWIALEGNPIDAYTLPHYVKFRTDQELRSVVPRSRPRLTDQSAREARRHRSIDEAANPATTTTPTEPQVPSRTEPTGIDKKCIFDLNISEMQGIRPTMEDTILVQQHRGIVVGSHTFQLLAIFDGHADAACAEFCATHMHDILQSELSYALQPKESSTSKVALLYKSDSANSLKRSTPSASPSPSGKEELPTTRPAAQSVSSAAAGTPQGKPSKRAVSGDVEHDYFISCVKHGLRNTFKRMNDCIDEYDIQSGCTVALALFCGNDAWLVSCGDARITVCLGNHAVRATVDHKASDREERHRIQALGGYITDTGRIMGMIAVARSLGDRAFRPYVAYTPAVKWMKITEESRFAIIACDGLWDVVSDDFAVKLVQDFYQKHGTYEGAALMLRDSAYALGSGDNISTMVVGLKPVPTEHLSHPTIPHRATTAPLEHTLSSSSPTSPSLQVSDSSSPRSKSPRDKRASSRKESSSRRESKEVPKDDSQGDSKPSKRDNDDKKPKKKKKVDTDDASSKED